MKVACFKVIRVVLASLVLLGAVGSPAYADNPAPTPCGRPNC
jgi:hypothetical protein